MKVWVIENHSKASANVESLTLSCYGSRGKYEHMAKKHKTEFCVRQDAPGFVHEKNRSKPYSPPLSINYSLLSVWHSCWPVSKWDSRMLFHTRLCIIESWHIPQFVMFRPIPVVLSTNVGIACLVFCRAPIEYIYTHHSIVYPSRKCTCFYLVLHGSSRSSPSFAIPPGVWPDMRLQRQANSIFWLLRVFANWTKI